MSDASFSLPQPAAPGEPRPWVRTVLAMSLDGKISDRGRRAARFPSAVDQQHLEQQLAWSDAALFGAGTLRAYGTSLRVRRDELLHQRQQRGQPPQPIHIVCSRSGALDPAMVFFEQPLPRWLLTSPTGHQRWQGQHQFERVWAGPMAADGFDWVAVLAELHQAGITRLLLMGGGQLVATLARLDLIDELRLTICPLLLGGSQAPTICDGDGFSLDQAPWFELVSAKPAADEIFLHYRRRGRPPI